MEWIVEARGCRAEALRDLTLLQQLFTRIITDLDLRTVGEAQWHRFPAPGGITGMTMLAESHLTIHTFPEHNSLCLNLFCCKPRAEWDFRHELATLFSAEEVEVRRIERTYNTAELAGTANHVKGAGR